MKDQCENCEGNEELQEHHVIPRSLGGTLKVTLCSKCHSLAHHNNMRINNLIKVGLNKARERGVVLGRPRKVFDTEKALNLSANGLGVRKIAKEVGVSYATVHRYLKEVNLDILSERRSLSVIEKRLSGEDLKYDPKDLFD